MPAHAIHRRREQAGGRHKCLTLRITPPFSIGVDLAHPRTIGENRVHEQVNRERIKALESHLTGPARGGRGPLVGRAGSGYHL